MRVLYAILMFAATLLLAACGGGDKVPYCGPGVSTCSSGGDGGTGGSTGAPTLILSISSTTVTSAAPATVTATARDAKGAAIVGQVVSFSSNGGLGAFSSNTVLTDAKGVATVQLSPASPTANGADLVVAKVSGTGTETSGTIGFQVVATDLPPVGSPTLVIALSQTTVTAGGPATVTSTFKDAAGNPLANAVVKFSAVDGLGAFNPTSALTDANGVAKVKLVPATPTTNGADLAVATTTYAGATLTAAVGFTASSPGAPSPGTPSIALSISSTTVTVASPATVTALARDANGSALPGQVVSFSTNGGLGAFDVVTALTDSQGVARVKLSPASPTANGADMVVAKVNGVSATIGFQVVAGSLPPVGLPTLAIALSSTTVTAAAPVTVTSTLKDAAGNPLSNSVVKFSTIDGLGAFNPSSALTDANGTVKVKLSPATSTTKGADLAVATTTVAGTLITATAGFTASSPDAPATGNASIALSLSNTTVTTLTPANAVAVVKDTTGAGVPGLVVKFKTVDGLGVFAVSSALTDASGTASAVLSAVGASQSGADQVIATTTFNGAALQAAQGFQLIATSATISGFSADVGSTLGAYGQTNLTVTVDGAPSGAPINLAVASDCAAKGKATITPASTVTTTGSATFTYRDGGCGAVVGNDTLTASIVGTSATRTLKLGLGTPTISAITFTSASPQTIYLKGSGLTETSTVTFTVVDTAGNGLPNQSVTLQPTTLSGGLTIDGGSVPVTKLSDSLGRVSVLINSGTVPTPVGVKATLGSATTVSSALSIAVGLPSELNFSLSQGTLNIEGYDRDGTPNTYSIIASDRLANPVPVGTSINFIAEGGQIEPIKTTELVNGIARASANFVSASPRPLDGRVTVLAYTLGEESFLDTNGNNIWDSPPDTAFQDLGSVFLSRNFLQKYFSATDQLIPLNIPGVDANKPCVAPGSPLLALDVTIPTVGSPTCDGKWGRAYVRRAAETVLSTSVARPLWSAPPSGLNADPGKTCPKAQDVTTDPDNPQGLIIGYNESTGNAIREAGPLYLVGGSTTLYNLQAKGANIISFMVADNNPVRLNPAAAGSSISVTGTEGLTVTVLGGSPVPSTLNATYAAISVAFADSTKSGAVTINVRSPSGVTSTTFLSVSVEAPVTGATPCP